MKDILPVMLNETNILALQNNYTVHAKNQWLPYGSRLLEIQRFWLELAGKDANAVDLSNPLTGSRAGPGRTTVKGGKIGTQTVPAIQGNKTNGQFDNGIKVIGQSGQLNHAEVKLVNAIAKPGDSVVIGTGKAAMSRLPQDAGVNSIAPSAKNTAGRTVGLSTTQNQVMQDDIKILNSMRVQDIRVNQQQVNASGCRVGICRPDTQGTLVQGSLPGGRRIYIEYDRSSSTRGQGHANRLLSNDPNAIVILRTVD